MSRSSEDLAMVNVLAEQFVAQLNSPLECLLVLMLLRGHLRQEVRETAYLAGLSHEHFRQMLRRWRALFKQLEIT